jgi:hypothetical protein
MNRRRRRPVLIQFPCALARQPRHDDHRADDCRRPGRRRA